ncbi:MAG TPA: 2'-5' RNA ligase family protein [Gemmatimonadaceae bacterium]|nr:2'-5' RNA ligase family protein [Gemmatimonadaceae bacterium]
MKSGIIILSELHGPVRDRVLEIQRRYDPKLAAMLAPHVTITGSSGIGPIAMSTTEDELRVALEPIARDTPPMHLSLGRPMRFMQTSIIVLPLDPHGPLRELHERIMRSGLRYERPRFTFTPHVTLNFFRQLTRDETQALLAERVDEPVVIDCIEAHRTTDTLSTSKVVQLTLGTGARSSPA